MTYRLFSGIAIATLVIGGGLVSSAANLRAAQDRPPSPATAPDTSSIVADESGMVALQRHAQVDMLLYPGGLSSYDRASVRSSMNAVALTLPGAAR